MRITATALLAPLVTCAAQAVGDASRLGQTSQFNISETRADVALTEFAQQSDMTVIVPFEQVVGIETRPLRGHYTIVEAALHLLEDTGLKLSVSGNGQLLISTDYNVKGNRFMLQKNKLSSAVLMAMSSLAGAQVVAQEAASGNFEEVVVTGLRGSLERAMDVKRDSSGVVDAISAEDMGKFPDTNLAESLQRITGVSISRENGEGSKVTVRGFGEDFNMVTLNGRTMPAADAPRDGAADGRGFDFAQLASEVVSGVEVYKTGRADIASGGIGASINLNTARPLDNPGLNVSLGVKGVHDTTNRTGDDVTPEISGLVSWTDSEDRFGIGVALSHQKRDSGATGSYVSEWNTRRWVDHDTDLASAMAITADGNGNRDITNAPDEGQLYGTPSDIRYTLSDRERTRTNGQVVFQSALSEDLEITLDYTFAENEQVENRSEMSIWYQQNADRVEFDTDQAVATPVIYSEDIDDTAGKDTSLAQQQRHQTNELESIGFNTDWQVNDRLNLAFDVHDSSAESLPTAPWGGSWMTNGMGARVVGHQQTDFSSDLPIMIVDSIADCGPAMNCNGEYDIEDVGSQVQQLDYSVQTTDITQFRLDGSWDFDNGKLQFGLEDRSVESHSLYSQNQNAMGDWGLANPGDIPNDMISPRDFTSQFDDYSTTSNQLGEAFNTAWAGNASELGQWGSDEYDFAFGPNPTMETDRLVEEEISAGYFQIDFSGELGDLPFQILTGVRYEETEVYSSAMVAIPSSITWESNNDFRVNRDGDYQPLTGTSKYDHLLPNLDVSLDLTDEIVTRFSYSKTIARPTYNNLSAAINVNAPSRPTTEGLVAATASTGNPGLVPLESDNLDLSLEWYYDDSSYASAGFFEKRVNNFVGTEPVDQPQFELRDPTAGPRAQSAREAIQARPDHDGIVDETELFTMVVAMENGLDYDSLDTDQVEIDYDVEANSDDPLYNFSTDTPVNNESAKIYGFELASQHFFGNSGFGVQANYTIVRGDVSFDNTGDPGEAQFALVGLSDTANVVLLYEKHGISARLAYNWRDDFLADTNRFNNNPEWVEDYSQIDMNISYDIDDNFQVFFEGINLTEENFRSHGRSSRQLWNLEDLGARYQVGARYTF